MISEQQVSRVEHKVSAPIKRDGFIGLLKERRQGGSSGGQKGYTIDQAIQIGPNEFWCTIGYHVSGEILYENIVNLKSRRWFFGLITDEDFIKRHQYSWTIWARV